MNSININNTEISVVKLADKQVLEMYLGTEKVYPNGLPSSSVNYVILNQNLTDPALMLSGDINSTAVQWIRQNSHRVVARSSGDGTAYYCRLDDANSNYYYDGTAANLTGAEGDVFMKLPQFFWKVTEQSTDVFKIGLAYGKKPDDTWKEWDGNVLIGVYKAYKINDIIYSVGSGKTPTSNQYLSMFKESARNKGTGYCLVDWEMHCVMAMLYYCLYGHMNCQLKIGSGTSNYKTTGLTSSLGMVDTVAEGNGNGGSINFWGLENWWGDLQEYVDNFKISGNDATIINPDGSSRIIQINNIDHSYPKKMVIGEFFDLIATVSSLDSNIGYCDEFYLNASSSNVALRSGSSSVSNCGVAFGWFGGSDTYRGANIGSRLAFRGQCIEETDVNKFKNGEDNNWYGVEFTSSNPVGTRIGDLTMHQTLPIQSKMRGCTITSDGTVKYLNPNDWTKYEDGTDRDYTLNTMVEIPEFYSYSQQITNDKFVLKISESAQYVSANSTLTPWYHHKKCYISAYEAYNEGSILKSVAKTSSNGDVYPTVSTTREQFQTYARANGNEHWNMYTYEAHKAMCWLYLVEYANRNSQADFNTTLTTEGYRQGGLGAGVTTGTGSTHSYNFTICGCTDSLGNNTGIVTRTAEGRTVDVPRYRGIENPFGSVWKNVIDVKCVNSYVYQCKDYNNFSSNNSTTNYTSLGSVYTSSGYNSKTINSSNTSAELFASAASGSDSTYWCDYYYGSSSSTYRTLLLGGDAGDGSTAGLFRLACGASLGYSYSYVGSRLTYLI